MTALASIYRYWITLLFTAVVAQIAAAGYGPSTPLRSSATRKAWGANTRSAELLGLLSRR